MWTDTRDTVVSHPPLFDATSSVCGREYGEYAGNDICDNRRRPERDLTVGTFTWSLNSQEWMSISLGGVLLDSDLWEKGIGSPVPDIPKMVVVLGRLQEEGSLSEDRDSGRCPEDFSKQIRTEFEERRSSRTSTETSKGDFNFGTGPSREKRRDNHGRVLDRLTRQRYCGIIYRDL